MTDYHLKPAMLLSLVVQEKKEKRRKVLEEVMKRRKIIYQSFKAKRVKQRCSGAQTPFNIINNCQ